MNRVAVIAVVAAIACFGVAHADQDKLLNPKEVVQKVHKGVIRVQTADVNALNSGQPPTSVGEGGGSGFIFEIDYDKGTAYAITNYHVAGHAAYVSATAWNHKVYNGLMVAAEPGIDIALIQLHGIPDERNLPDDQKNLIPIVLGDSDKVEPGDQALSMGSPGSNEGYGTDRSDPYATFMMDQTAAVNVIAGRQTPLDWAMEMWEGARSSGEIQNWEYATNLDYTFRMSTTINHGNSGGPLLNSRGEVIGINTWGQYNAIMQDNNACVPINLAKDFAYQVINTGKFQKPWLGLDLIFPQSVDSEEAYQEFRERYRPDKLEVYGVRRNSPAAAAGFKTGDVILDINGQKFKTPEDVRLWVFSQDIGTPLHCRIVRDGRVMNDPITVNVGAKRTYDSEFSV